MLEINYVLRIGIISISKPTNETMHVFTVMRSSLIFGKELNKFSGIEKVLVYISICALNVL